MLAMTQNVQAHDHPADFRYYRYLLSMGANPEAVTDTGTTPLYRAARNGSVEAVKMLLMVGVLNPPASFTCSWGFSCSSLLFISHKHSLVEILTGKLSIGRRPSQLCHLGRMDPTP